MAGWQTFFLEKRLEGWQVAQQQECSLFDIYLRGSVSMRISDTLVGMFSLLSPCARAHGAAAAGFLRSSKISEQARLRCPDGTDMCPQPPVQPTQDWSRLSKLAQGYKAMFNLVTWILDPVPAPQPVPVHTLTTGNLTRSTHAAQLVAHCCNELHLSGAPCIFLCQWQQFRFGVALLE